VIMVLQNNYPNLSTSTRNKLRNTTVHKILITQPHTENFIGEGSVCSAEGVVELLSDLQQSVGE